MATSIGDRLRSLALSYPEAVEDFPWGERVVKVRKKIFVFLGLPDGPELTVTVKLPNSVDAALMFPFASPTGYGLGRAGWVSCRFPKKSAIPIELVEAWIDESYRAVAPKKLVLTLDAEHPTTPPRAQKPTRPRSRR
jgi:predicted DNA-binding protein (MmcQ/YjbR family)